jgi:hypothetical protein
MDTLFTVIEQSLEGFKETERHTIWDVRFTLIEKVKAKPANDQQSEEVPTYTEAVQA